jgi:hypothetical protein
MHACTYKPDCCPYSTSSNDEDSTTDDALTKQNELLATKNEYGQTALMLAIEVGCNKEALFLLSLDISQLEHTNKYQKYSFAIAIETGNVVISKHIVDLILSGKTSHVLNDIKVGYNRNTPLMFACMSNDQSHHDILIYLLKNVSDIDINATNRLSDCCFNWTVTRGNIVVMKAIIGHQKFKLTIEIVKHSLLKLCRYGHEDCVVYLFYQIMQKYESRSLKIDIMREAWKFGMVKLATLHLMTNTHHTVTGRHWDMLGCPLERFLKKVAICKKMNISFSQFECYHPKLMDL